MKKNKIKIKKIKRMTYWEKLLIAELCLMKKEEGRVAKLLCEKLQREADLLEDFLTRDSKDNKKR